MLAWEGVLSHDSVLSRVPPTPPDDDSIGDSNVKIGANYVLRVLSSASVN